MFIVAICCYMQYVALRLLDVSGFWCLVDSSDQELYKCVPWKIIFAIHRWQPLLLPNTNKISKPLYAFCLLLISCMSNFVLYEVEHVIMICLQYDESSGGSQIFLRKALKCEHRSHVWVGKG